MHDCFFEAGGRALFSVGDIHTHQDECRAKIGHGSHGLVEHDGTCHNGAHGVEIDVVGGFDGTNFLD